jgi:hypothetical protein
LTIQPVDCKEAINALEEMYALVQKCNSLLDDSSRLPVAALAPRYRLLFASQLVLDQTRQLIDLFNSYRVMCLRASSQAERTHKKIQKVFQEVLQNVSDIPRQALYLEEKSQSMEQELLATLGDGYI